MRGKTDEELARILWDYNNIKTPLEKADIILGLGNSYHECAEHAADLFLKGYAPLILFSGGYGRLTKDVFHKPEADVFADIAIKKGVPEENVIIENKSKNTGENISFSKKIINSKNLNPECFIIVTQPYQARRALATFEKFWPNKKLIPSSANITFDEFCSDRGTSTFINTLVAVTQRIIIYPEKGFQIPQEMPDEVRSAYEELIKRGYDQQLVT